MNLTKKKIKKIPRYTIKIIKSTVDRFYLYLKIRSKNNLDILSINGEETKVDNYWGQHTVSAGYFPSTKSSIENLESRFSKYPLFREYMELWGDHKDQVILDYGCGPGNDLIGFALYSKAKKVIGVDISKKALKQASDRLKLHDIKNVELVKITDNVAKLPFEDSSIDYIYCEGVLHHTSNPFEILKEFRRILKNTGKASIMVYNKDSAWYHLYAPYVIKIHEGKYTNLNDDELFQKTTDGVNCPIARSYTPDEFSEMCQLAGFKVDYVGGYFSTKCLEVMEKYWEKAMSDDRLDEKHKNFLKNVQYNGKWYYYNNKTIGIGGVYFIFPNK